MDSQPTDKVEGVGDASATHAADTTVVKAPKARRQEYTLACATYPSRADGGLRNPHGFRGRRGDSRGRVNGFL